MNKKLIIVAVGALVICGLLLSSGALAVKPTNNGNEMPPGPHYNLNIIGVDTDDKPVGGSMGHTVFVNLNKRTDILMTQDETDVFKVVDRNGLDDDEAKFNIAGGAYDVYARPLGSPNGGPWVDLSAYATKDGEIQIGTVHNIQRDHGKPKTKDISNLFYLGGEWIFDIDDLENYYWKYDNKGLKLLQVRFYPSAA